MEDFSHMNVNIALDKHQGQIFLLWSMFDDVYIQYIVRACCFRSPFSLLPFDAEDFVVELIPVCLCSPALISTWHSFIPFIDTWEQSPSLSQNDKHSGITWTRKFNLASSSVLPSFCYAQFNKVRM